MKLSRKLESWQQEFDGLDYGECFRLLAAEATELETKVARLQRLEQIIKAGDRHSKLITDWCKCAVQMAEEGDK